MCTDFQRSWQWMLIASLCAGFSGCAMFAKDQASLAYEQAKRDVENPHQYGVQQASHEEDGLAAEDFAPKNIKGTVKKMIGKGPNEQRARDLFAEGQDKYNAAAKAEADERGELFLAAADLFQKAAERLPESKLEHDALFMRGESLFFADRYPAANLTYEELLSRYPNSQLLDTVEARRLSIAQYWEEIHRTDPKPFYAVNVLDGSRPKWDLLRHATRVYDKIRVDDPTGKYADDATMALANSHFRSERYVYADQAYTDLITAFPTSPHAFQAHMLALQCRLRSYQGPNYSSVPLDGAAELLKDIQRLFPVEAQKETEALTKAAAEVRFRQAEREWSTAQYYERQRGYRSARIHYEKLVQQFEDTAYADKARERLEQISDKPDTPPQRLSWLVKIFPEAEEQKPLIATSPGLSETR